MSEMLGNHYFLVRRYASACSVFEDELVDEPGNYQVMKKLVVCYLKLGYFRKGFELFHCLMVHNPEIIFGNQPDLQTCPCREIIADLQAAAAGNLDDKEYNMILGILWSYLDLNKALKYFKKARGRHVDTEKVELIIERLESRASV